MRHLLARPLAVLSFLTAGLCLATSARAELVWTPQTGWRVEGGSLSGLTGSEATSALALMNSARLSEEKGSPGSALSGYNKVAKRFPNSVFAPEALYRVARLRLARKQYFDAFDAFQNLVGRYPNTPRFSEVIGEQYRIASAMLDGARNRIWGFLPGFTNRSKALEYFEIILANAPYSDYAPLSLMNIARGHQKLGESEEAIDALDRMVNTYPQSLLAPDAYIKLGQAHAELVDGPDYDQASTKEALTYFDDFQILFPSDPNIAAAAKGSDRMKVTLAESKMRIGDFYFLKRNNYTAAKVFYNEAVTAYPDSAVAARAKKRLAAVEAKSAGKPAPADKGDAPKAEKKKKRFWLF